MKYLLIYIILSQVCSPKGTGYEAPPYFYMQCYDTKEEAEKKKKMNYTKILGHLLLQVTNVVFNSTRKEVNHE